MLNTVIVKKHLGIVEVIMPRVETQRFTWHSTSYKDEWMNIQGEDSLHRPVEIILPVKNTNYIVIG